MLSIFNRIDHIGFAVKDINTTAAFYVKNGWELSPIVQETVQHARIAFLTNETMPTIELVSPLEGASPVDRFLLNGGVQPYHICYEVDDVMAAINELHNQDFIPLFMPVQSVAMEGRLICYLYNKDVGLIEVVESKHSN